MTLFIGIKPAIQATTVAWIETSGPKVAGGKVKTFSSDPSQPYLDRIESMVSKVGPHISHLISPSRPDVFISGHEGGSGHNYAFFSGVLVGELLGELSRLGHNYCVLADPWKTRLCTSNGADLRESVAKRMGVTSPGRTEEEVTAFALAIYAWKFPLRRPS